MNDERDTRETPARLAIRMLYVDRRILPGPQTFACECLQRCSEAGRLHLHTGNWAFVGSGYGQAKINGHRARILFVAMDIGGHGEAQLWSFADAQREFRQAGETRRNPHMGGVALIMQHLVDDSDPRRIASQFALTNAVKCVEHTGTMSTKPSQLMIFECSHHLKAEIEVLKPDVIITQGSHPARTVSRLLGPAKTINTFTERGRETTVSRANNIILVTTPHPARQPGLKWRQGILPEFFVAAVEQARHELTIVLRSRADATP